MKMAQKLTVSLIMIFTTIAAFAQTPICQLPTEGVPMSCDVVSHQYGNQGAAMGVGPSDTVCPQIAIPIGYENCTRVLKCFKAGIDTCHRISKNGNGAAVSSNQNVYCQSGNLKQDSNGKKDTCQRIIKEINKKISLPIKKN
jgi:hypothetical protein